MFTMILISSAALLAVIIGCVVIWGFDANRAEEIAHTPERAHTPDRADDAMRPRPVQPVEQER